MPVQINIFLLLFGALQGILLSFVLIRKKTYRSGYIFLSIYVVLLLIQIAMKVISKVWVMSHMMGFYGISYRLPFLYGPLVYLLCCYLLIPGRKFRSVDMLHFLPFALAIFSMYVYPDGGFVTDLFMNHNSSLTLQLLTISIYHAAALYQWYSHRRIAKNNFSNLSQVQVSWLRIFIILSFMIAAVIAVALYFLYVYYPQWNNLRFLFVGLTVFIYWISFTAMNKPELFTVIKGTGANREMPLPKLSFHLPQQRYNNSGLREEEANRILSSLQELMNNKKPYLDPSLTMEDLSKQMQCSKHHLSQVLNDHLHRSFYDYINSFRVEAAKQLLADPSKDAYKVAAIAYDAGFNSLSAFNDVFKKVTGTTPSKFRNQQTEESRKQRV